MIDITYPELGNEDTRVRTSKSFKLDWVGTVVIMQSRIKYYVRTFPSLQAS